MWGSARRLSASNKDIVVADESNDVFEETRHEFSSAKDQRLKKQEDHEKSLKNPVETAEFPCFARNEIKEGKFLGKGTFCIVKEIQSLRLQTGAEKSEDTTEEEEDDFSEESLSREFLAQHCRRPSGDARYAIKQIHPSIMGNARRFRAAAMDLATETQFLANLEHPHIVKLRSMSSAVGGGDDEPLAVVAPEDGAPERSFLILDRLYETLSERIERRWKPQQKAAMSSKRRLLLKSPDDDALQDLLAERVGKAFDISSALSYLHARRIIHRDIKPENIGFDIRGDVKIFDFGLARQLPDQEGTFRLSKAGSLRFMAPEVALDHPYNELCDVYSFSVLFWEMLSCARPYERFKSEAAFVNAVFVKNCRPRIPNRVWPKAIQLLIQQGWSVGWQERPSMAKIESILRGELLDLREGECCALTVDKTRRRSTVVFRPKRTQGPHRR